ncbi:MAG: glycosyltransferase [Dehalococcoidia bacterium]|nr:glycosyltransferase [Dehalococcoidia bacterium]
MRVLIAQETDWIKRPTHQQHHLAEMLSLRGHEVRAIDFELLWKGGGRRGLRSPREVFPDVAKIHRGAKVTVIRPSIVRLPVLDYVSLIVTHRQEIRRQLAEFSPHVIVGLGILNSYLAMRAARASGIPFVYYWIDVLHDLIPVRVFRPLGRAVEGAVLKRADRVLVINSRLREYVEEMGARPEVTTVVRAGIDLKKFDPAMDGAAMREKYGFRKDDIVLFFMGWLYRFSGLKEVVEELARARDDRIRMLIVGEGDLFEDLQAKVREHNLQGKVILTGKKPYQEIPSHIAAADICLLPAYANEKIMQHIVPIKLYEYMAMRKPVIATKLPGIVAEFGEGNGLVYVHGPEEVIPRALEIVRNGNLQELGSRARAFVEVNTWDAVADQFERILEEAVKEKENERLQK